ncbi:MAG: guanylate kinase [Arcanobacterium sp.]|nr:guanylate kinase [Arcanobacterium sp.]
MNENQARVFVITGPTAVGKGTIRKELFSQLPNLWFSVSATTRDQRPGEEHGKDYFFISAAEFDELVANKQMLEWAVVHKVNRYGTPRQPVLEALDSGKIAILELDLAGARQVRETMPEATQIFIAPPSWEELERRLVGRGTETAEEQARRLETAKLELAAQAEFDFVIINDTVANATNKLVQIITGTTVE